MWGGALAPGSETHAAVRLQVAADPLQVGPQPAHVLAVGPVVRQHALQEDVQDVGVEAADLHVVLHRSKVRGQRRGPPLSGTRRLTWWAGAWGSRRTLGSSCSSCACGGSRK